jgi:hypothetical protein
MKTTIITTLLIVAAIGGLIWWGSKNQAPQAESIGQENALTVPSKLYDFGTISMKNNEVTKDFIVSNPTNNDIVLPTLVTSCMCTKAYFVLPDGNTKGPFGMPGMGYVPSLNEKIGAGESRTIRVVYDPNAHGPAGVGSIDRFITLTDSTGRDLKLEIKAVVTP